MTDDDIVTVIQANKFSSDPLAIYRAIIAARDEELRKQEPVAWIHPLYKESGFKLVGITRWSDDCLPLYAAPTPPTPSQQEALNDLRELDTNFEFEGRMAVLRNHLHHFILARPDEVTKNDRNKDGAIEFIDAVVLNKPIWPNPWGQDVAFAAFKMHTDTARISGLEQAIREHLLSHESDCVCLSRLVKP